MKDVEFLKYATFRQRLIAFIIDLVLLTIIEIVLFLLPNMQWVREQLMKSFMFSVGFFLLYFGGQGIIFGSTLGKMILRLKIVNKKGNKPGVLRVLVREGIGKYITLTSFGLGFVAMWLSEEGAAWHDSLSGTRVITSKKRSHRRNVGWFYGLVLLILGFVGLLTYTGIKEILKRDEGNQFCAFNAIEPEITTNHFDFYFEDTVVFTPEETELFEMAFDYVFWSISGVKDKVTRTRVCVYSDNSSYEKASTEAGVLIEESVGFFSGQESVLHLSPSLRWYDNMYKEETIYHEITHYVINNYFFQNSAVTYVNNWFNEGLAQHFSEYCVTEENKKQIDNKKVAWETMRIPYYNDEDFSVSNYYLQSCLMTEYLLESNNSDFLKNVIRTQINDWMQTELAIETVTKIDFAQLESNWKEWLKI